MAIVEVVTLGSNGRFGPGDLEAAATDSHVAKITASIMAALGNISESNGSSFTPATVEQVRAYPSGHSYPLVQLGGPFANVNSAAHFNDNHTLAYDVTVSMVLGDDDDDDDPATYQVRNIAADIQKAVMADVTRSGLAMYTRVGDYGYALEPVDEETVVFVVVQEIEVLTKVNPFDPYQ